MASNIGIDLGTTNSLVAVVMDGKARCLLDEQGSAMLPSAVRYDPYRDFAPIHMLATLPLLLIGRPDLPPTLPELLALNATRSQPFTSSACPAGPDSAKTTPTARITATRSNRSRAPAPSKRPTSSVHSRAHGSARNCV